MIPMLPNICNIYNIRHPTFHLPLEKHDFAEQRLDYQFIKLLNTSESTAITLKAQSLFFYGFKTFCQILHSCSMLIVVMMFIV